jgi:16S rRNA (cytosine1402-N4)-methyltransferase
MSGRGKGRPSARKVVETQRGEQEPGPNLSDHWSEKFGHMPVMLRETVEALAIKPDGFYIDATLGGGGHSRAILERLGKEGELLAMDFDPEPLEWARSWGGDDPRLKLVRMSFACLSEYMTANGMKLADGLLADLGPNSRQLLNPLRGFSFKGEGPLDMRMDSRSKTSAQEIVNTASELELVDIFHRLGEIRSAAKLARMVVERREKGIISSTAELAEIAEAAFWRPGPRPRLHPATKMFMALRLAVNNELENLGQFLASARSCLKDGGRLCIISFHSLEDRMVKRFMRLGEQEGDGGQGDFRPVRRKAIKPSDEEVAANPRARSARLRVAEAI